MAEVRFESMKSRRDVIAETTETGALVGGAIGLVLGVIGGYVWGGAAGTVSWTDPENELVGVLMLQQPRVGKKFGKAVREAIIE